jgi:hypothetical protein
VALRVLLQAENSGAWKRRDGVARSQNDIALALCGSVASDRTLSGL